MAHRSSSTNSGTGDPISVGVPASVAAGDIVVIVASTDASADEFNVEDFPPGFVKVFDDNLTLDGQNVGVGWKRLSAADSGSYTFGAVGVTPWVAQAFAFSGRDHALDPGFTHNLNNSGNSDPVSVTATGLIAVAGDDLLWISAPDPNTDGGTDGHDPPSGFTERQDAENGFTALSGATQDNVSAGATGDITGTLQLAAGTSGWAAFLARIPAPGAGADAATPRGGPGRLRAFLKPSDIHGAWW